MNDSVKKELSEALSNRAIARRDEMLDQLVAGMRSLHHRRRNRKRIGLAATVVALGASVTWWLQPAARVTSPRPPIIVQVTPNSRKLDESVMIVERLHTDASVTARCRVVGESRHTVILDDSMLLDVLAQIDRPAGLIRTPTRTWLTNPVADNLEHDEPSHDGDPRHDSSSAL